MGVKASFSSKKEEELFCLKIQMKKTWIEALMDLGSESNFISEDLMVKFG